MKYYSSKVNLIMKQKTKVDKTVAIQKELCFHISQDTRLPPNDISHQPIVPHETEGKF